MRAKLVFVGFPLSINLKALLYPIVLALGLNLTLESVTLLATSLLSLAKNLLQVSGRSYDNHELIIGYHATNKPHQPTGRVPPIPQYLFRQRATYGS